MAIYPNKLKRFEMDTYHICNTNSDNFHISPIARNSSFISWLSQRLTRGREIISLILFIQLLSCDPMDCSPPGFSVHEIFQARILEWVCWIDACLFLVWKSLEWGDYFVYENIVLCWAWDYWTVELEWTLDVIFVSLFVRQIYSNMCLLSAWGPKRPEKWLSTLCFESPGNIF